jgi:hypothetical protein
VQVGQVVGHLIAGFTSTVLGEQVVWHGAEPAATRVNMSLTPGQIYR